MSAIAVLTDNSKTNREDRMKVVNKLGAQGDVLFARVDAIPDGLEPVPATGGRHVVAHSETGHDHYLDASGVVLLRVPSDPLVAYLRIDGEYGDVVHARPHDTHETLRLTRGLYQVRRQREYTPEGWRRVED